MTKASIVNCGCEELIKTKKCCVCGCDCSFIPDKKKKYLCKCKTCSYKTQPNLNNTDPDYLNHLENVGNRNI